MIPHYGIFFLLYLDNVIWLTCERTSSLSIRDLNRVHELPPVPSTDCYASPGLSEPVGSASKQHTEQHICTIGLDHDCLIKSCFPEFPNLFDFQYYSLTFSPQLSFKQHKKIASRNLTFCILKPAQIHKSIYF